MMKSFFKKLAIVMALAMVVTLAAPAAQASAATALAVALQSATAKEEAVTEYKVAVEETVDFKYYYAPKNYKELAPTWTSSNEEVASVNQKGEVTGLKDGVATITIALSNGQQGSVDVTVGVGEVNIKAFEAKQISDTKVELKFNDKEVTKAALQAALNFYYYINDYKVEVPTLIKSISDVKDGVATVELHTTMTDGFTYGFGYGEEISEFKAEIGAVASIYFTYDKAYVNEYTQLKPVLLNANGIDITSSALKVTGSYVMFTEDPAALNGEYWVVNDTIYFSEVCAAQVKVQYFGGYNDNGDAIVGPSITLPVVSQVKPAYGINFTAAPTVDIAKAENFDDGLNTKLAVGDEGFNLFIKVKDNTNNNVTSTNESNGAWRFESTNVSRLYVTDKGLLMPNAAGAVSVLVYYKPSATNVESLVAVVPVTVSPARATANVTLDKTSATVSTVENYNKAEFTVALTDSLGQARPAGQEVVVKTTTNITTAKAKPSVNGNTSGEVKLTTGADGKVKITVVASEDNIATGSTSGVQTYSFTVTSNNITRSFSVTIKKPQMNGTEIVASGYKLDAPATKDIKIKDNANLKLEADFVKLSSGVAVATQDFAGAKPANAKDATMNKFYYVVTKNGNDITSAAQLNGSKITVELTKTEATTVASGTSIDVVNKTQGVGTYRVVVYQAIGSTGATTPSSFKTVTSATVTVNDTQDTASYGGKINATAAVGTSEVDIVKNCFKFVVGGTTYDAAGDYTDAYIVPNCNTVNNGNVVYVNSVTLYKKASDCNAYIKYVINVGDYVTLQ